MGCADHHLDPDGHSDGTGYHELYGRTYHLMLKDSSTMMREPRPHFRPYLS